MRPLARVSACLFLAGVTACAAGPGGTRRSSSGSPFPTRAEIDALTHGSGAVSPYSQAVVDADKWTFTEPAALRLEDEPFAEESFWGELLRRYAKSHPELVPTRSMHCAAREMARFYLEYAATPADPLRDAMLGRCGALSVEAMPSYVFGPVTPSQSEEAIQNQWRANAQQLMSEYAGAGQRSVGIAFARDDKKAVIVFLSGVRRAQLEPVSRQVSADGHVVLTGRALMPVMMLTALANQGRHGFARCDSDADLKLPDFRLTCPLAASDSQARIVVSAFEPGRVLGRALLKVEAVRGAPSGEYRRASYAGDSPVAGASELPERLLGLVNGLREQAGVAPVALSSAETKTSTQLAPRYFESFGKPGGQDAAEVIMLGLMAGWDVEREAIRTAGFTSGAAGPTRDASDWLSAVMSDPSGRAALLEPSARVVAFGGFMPESPPMIASIFTSYSFFETGDDEAFKRGFLDKLRAARTAQGLTPPVVITTLDGDAAAVAAGLREGRATPHESLQALAKTGVEVLGRPVQCFAVEATDLSVLPVPDELLAPGNLEVSVTVTHYQPDDGAWGRFAVLLVVPGEAPRA